jgi:hypothetical protein
MNIFEDFWYDSCCNFNHIVAEVYLQQYAYVEVSEDSELTCPENDCLKCIGKYDAIVYLTENGKRSSEWCEAGLFAQVCEIVSSTDLFSIAELRNMIAEAEQY